MKRALFTFSLVMAIAAAIAQNVPREMVVLEIGTGTWCPYCPGAAMGADDLLENGHHVAVVENHNGDSYANAYSNSRNSMYGVSAYPSAAFDGIQGYVGGSNTSSLYYTYLGKYNACIAFDSPVAMTMDVEEADGDYNVTVEMTKVGDITATNIVLYFFVTQSHISQNWQGQTHLEHVNRLMVPDQNGTVVDFSGGDVQTVDLSFTLNAAWPVEDCEFIALLQDKTPGQGVIPGTSPYTLTKWAAIQTIKRAAVDLSVDFEASSTVVDKNSQVTFTNLTTGGYIGTDETYEWILPGAQPETSTDKNPTVMYKDCGVHDVTLIVDRGGQIDTLVKSEYIQVGPVVEITSDPGDTTCWYQPITLDATNTLGESYLWEPGGATTPVITVTHGDVGYGAHTFEVTITSPNGCVAMGTHEIFFDECTGIEEPATSLSATIYPNPNNGRFVIELNAPEKTTVDIQIVNTLGSQVYEETGIQVNGQLQKTFNVNLKQGVYFLVIRSGGEKSMQKLFITQ